MTIKTINKAIRLAVANDCGSTIALQDAVTLEGLTQLSVADELHKAGATSADLDSKSDFAQLLKAQIAQGLFKMDSEFFTEKFSIINRMTMYKLWSKDKAARKECSAEEKEMIRYVTQQVGSKLGKYRGQLEVKEGIVKTPAEQGPEETQVLATEQSMQSTLRKVVEARKAFDKAYESLETKDAALKAAFHIGSDKLVALLVAPAKS